MLVVKADNLDFERKEDVEDIADKVAQMKKNTLYYVPLDRQNQKKREKTDK